MNEVSIVITTTGRPDFLRTALQSVQNQLNPEHIGEVIVSENKGYRATEDVLHEFADLPIRYLFREPTLPMVEHFFSTARQARKPYVAILNDDDWWASNHLSEALSALKLNPLASAYTSASVWVQNEADASPWGIFRSPTLWLLAGRLSWLRPWAIDAPTMLALNWLFTPFHWSTLVSSTAALHDVVDTLESITHSLKHVPQGDYLRHTLDRFVFNHLVLHGAFCYNPVPDTFIRWHSSNWVKDKDPSKVSQMLRSTAVATEILASERGWNLQKIWAHALSNIPTEFRAELLDRFHEGHTDADLQRYGFEQFFRDVHPGRRANAFRNILGNAKTFVLGR